MKKQTIFITGATSGIGLAMAQEYARQGAVLGLLARRSDVLEQIRAQLPNAEQHEVYAVDVCVEADLHGAAHDFISKHGAPDIVIASAGISMGTWTEHYKDLAKIRQIFEVNVLAMASTFHPFIAPMKARGQGALVGFASVAGIRGLVGSEAYSASKAAVISYCESLRGELRKTGVKVLTISPGYIATPMTAANPYRMPFLMQSQAFAQRAVRAIAHQKSYTVIPWQMGVVAKFLRVLPNVWFDMLVSERKHKPRATTPTDFGTQ